MTSQSTIAATCASPWSAFQAAQASARIIEDGNYKYAHIHFWMIQLNGVSDLLKEKLEGEFAGCDALIIDLPGRGGNAMALPGIYDVLTGEKSTWKKPVVALVNEYSRSAASSTNVGLETMLMYPTFRMGKYTDAIEGIGVEPDVLVKDAGPCSHGADPLLEGAIEQARMLVAQ